MTVDLCDLCGHSWDEHDAMGDCCHADARTKTGFCRKHDGDEHLAGVRRFYLGVEVQG